jgi:hypothetical protein
MSMRLSFFKKKKRDAELFRRVDLIKLLNKQ